MFLLFYSVGNKSHLLKEVAMFYDIDILIEEIEDDEYWFNIERQF